jgi:hypothetical protein
MPKTILTATIILMNHIKTNIKVALYLVYIFGLFLIVEVIDVIRGLGKRHAYKHTQSKNLQNSKAQVK